METSILIARLAGPILLVASASMLISPRNLQELAREFLKYRSLIYVTGVLAMLGGLAIVNSHNKWIADWPLIITLLGWALVIGGATRMAFPSMVQSVGKVMMENATLIRISGAAWTLIGAFLTYKGYF